MTKKEKTINTMVSEDEKFKLFKKYFDRFSTAYRTEMIQQLRDINDMRIRKNLRNRISYGVHESRSVR